MVVGVWGSWGYDIGCFYELRFVRLWGCEAKGVGYYLFSGYGSVCVVRRLREYEVPGAMI